MGNVYFTSDPHLGHRGLIHFKYRMKEGKPLKSVDENTQIFVDEWEKTVSKKDLVYCLGDMAFDREHHDIISGLSGRKILVKGNHEELSNVSDQEFLKTYEKIEGTHKKYGFWISHFPVHPQELWDKKCICGHVHHANVLLSPAGDNYWQKHAEERRETKKITDIPHPWPAPKSLEDPRYLNLCPENTQLIWGKWIISLDEIREYLK